MSNKSIFGVVKPHLTYQPFTDTLKAAVTIPVPSKVTVFLDTPLKRIDLGTAPIKEGDAVRTGQRLSLSADDTAAGVMAPVTGKIAAIGGFTGDYGKELTAITIETAAAEEFDETFAEAAEQLTLASAQHFLSHLPGDPPWKLFTDPERPIKTIVVNGADQDILVNANQYVTANQTEALIAGIAAIKQVTGVEDVYLALGRDRFQGMGHVGANLIPVDARYPGALPRSIMKDAMGQVVPAGQNPEDLGVAFFSAKAAAAIGQAVQTKRLPVSQLLTFINKDGRISVVKARLGTPLSAIFSYFDVTLEDRDRIVLGGPMTGQAIYSTGHPVQADTDAVMVQARHQIPYVSDYPCIHCGNCVQACPALIQVNMLVRFLEAGQYQDAADGYDLWSCIDCGLCSYVCPARIPIFQYIRLAKYELSRSRETEEATVEETDA